MGRGQVSVEYLVMIGIALGVLIPAVFFFLSYSQSNERLQTGSQVNEIGLEMVAVAKSTYALGANARRTLEVNMPDTVLGTSVYGRELVITYETGFGPSSAIFFSDINLTTDNSTGEISSAHPGLTTYRFISEGNAVSVNEVQ